MAMKMEFNPSKSEIEPKYRDGLTQVANFMKANPGIIATVEGHADRVVGIGSEKVKVDHNVAMEVSERRAQNVVNYFLRQRTASLDVLLMALHWKSNRRTAGSTSFLITQNNSIKGRRHFTAAPFFASLVRRYSYVAGHKSLKSAQ
jgi:hypothetical protein